MIKDLDNTVIKCLKDLEEIENLIEFIDNKELYIKINDRVNSLYWGLDKIEATNILNGWREE